MAHGTRYIVDDPFVPFDLFDGDTDIRLPYLSFLTRVGDRFTTAKCLHIGQPISIKKVEKMLNVFDGNTYGYHMAIDPVEGAVWRCEREGKVDFLAKWVRHDKEDGKYFNEDHSKLVWNWRE
jgi:hypothetical protein